MELSHSIQVSERKIAIWFQNRRSKLKKNQQTLKPSEKVTINGSTSYQPSTQYVNNFIFPFSVPTNLPAPMTNTIPESVNRVKNCAFDAFSPSSIGFPLTRTSSDQVNQSTHNPYNFLYPSFPPTGMPVLTESNTTWMEKNVVAASHQCQWPNTETNLNQQSYFYNNFFPEQPNCSFY